MKIIFAVLFAVIGVFAVSPSGAAQTGGEAADYCRLLLAEMDADLRDAIVRNLTKHNIGCVDLEKSAAVDKSDSDDESSGVTAAAETPVFRAAGVIIEPKCVNEGDTNCWLETANIAGCYILDGVYYPEETVTWSGGCKNGIAAGEGTEKWRGENGKTYEGNYVDGKRQGKWVVRFDENNAIHEGGYVDDKRQGKWAEKWDGGESEGNYVDGKRQGKWVARFGENGAVRESRYVDGERRGEWVEKQAAAEELETSDSDAAETAESPESDSVEVAETYTFGDTEIKATAADKKEAETTFADVFNFTAETIQELAPLYIAIKQGGGNIPPEKIAALVNQYGGVMEGLLSKGANPAVLNEENLIKVAQAADEGGVPLRRALNEVGVDTANLTDEDIAELQAAAKQTAENSAASIAIEPKCVNEEVYLDCWKETANIAGCYIFKNRFYPSQTTTWSGGCKNGVAVGEGTQKWQDSSLEHTGTLVDGKAQGKWVARYANGHVTEWDCVDGECQ